MTSDTGQGGSRAGSETGRFTVRRLRSALSLWRASIRGTDILLASVLVALSLGLGAYLLARAQAAAQLAFAERAQRMLAAINAQLAGRVDDLAAIAAFFQASDKVSRSDFRVFTAPMLRRDRFLYALEWLPLVPDSEREARESEAHASGLTDYGFWEIGPDGKTRAAERRPFYIPIQFMEPPNVGALGFDIASETTRWLTAQRARDTGAPAASRPFRLVQDPSQAEVSPAVAVYAPVYSGIGDPASVKARRESLRGFAVAVFRVEPLVNVVAAQEDPLDLLAFALRDHEATRAPPLAVRPGNAAAIPRRRGLEIQFDLGCADRLWALDVFARPGAFLPSKRASLEAAGFGMFVALLGLVAATSFRTIVRLRRQAEKVGPYRLVARLGQGAMGVVWEARHALLRRPTAIKLLAPGIEGERSLARFEREVQLTAGLTHPSTIAIYDYGRTAEGTFYYAMELLRGINLVQLVALEGPLPPARVVHFLKQACGALAEAHAAGLIHRDIKPANLMICVQGGIPDFLKVLDFGLVKDIGAVERIPDGKEPRGPVDAGLSQDGSLLGTPLYMAPEGMSDPVAVDARADLFALGAVGYFLLTGHSPFPGRTAIEVFAMERQGPPPLARAGPHHLPAALEETISRCLAFRRESRPGSAEALAAMLECSVTPPWSLEDARSWWRDRGAAALDAARAQREEKGQILVLSSRSGDPRPQ